MGAREDMLSRIAAAKDSKEAEDDKQRQAEKADEEQRNARSVAEAAKQEHMANLHSRVRDALNLSGEKLNSLIVSNEQKRAALLASQQERVTTQAGEDEALFNDAAESGVEMSVAEKNDITQEAKTAIKGETKEAIKAAHREWKGSSRDAALVAEVSEAFEDMDKSEQQALDEALESNDLTAVAKVSETYKARPAERRKAEEAAMAEKTPEGLMNKMNGIIEEVKSIEADVVVKWHEINRDADELKYAVKAVEKAVDEEFKLSGEKVRELGRDVGELNKHRDQHYAAHRTAVMEALNNPVGEALKRKYQSLRDDLQRHQERLIALMREHQAAGKSYLEQTAKPTGYIPMLQHNTYEQADLDKIPKLPNIAYRGIGTDPLKNNNEDLRHPYLERSESYNPSPEIVVGSDGKPQRGPAWTHSYNIVSPSAYNYGLSEALKTEKPN